MCGVHNFLPAKIPHIESYILAAINLDIPSSEPDTLGFLLTSFEGVIDEPINQRGLAHAASAYENKFRFVERLALSTSEIVVQNR